MNLEDIYALKAPQPYQPTIPFDGVVVDSYHRSLINAPLIEERTKF